MNDKLFTITKLPFDIQQYVLLEYFSGLEQLELVKIFPHLSVTDLLSIGTLYKDIDLTEHVINNKYLKKLYAFKNITDDHIINLTQIIELSASGNKNITDKGIKNMNLKYLLADSSGITDKGIKHMNLEFLCVSKNSLITGEGIKNSTSLHTLIAGIGSGITNKELENLNLSELRAITNPNITHDGIKHMTNLKDKWMEQMRTGKY